MDTNVENIWLNNNSFIKSVNNEFKPVNNLESLEVFSFCNFPSTTQMRLSANSNYLTGMWTLIIEYTKQLISKRKMKKNKRVRRAFIGG